MQLDFDSLVLCPCIAFSLFFSLYSTSSVSYIVRLFHSGPFPLPLVLCIACNEKKTGSRKMHVAKKSLFVLPRNLCNRHLSQACFPFGASNTKDKERRERMNETICPLSLHLLFSVMLAVMGKLI